MTVVRRGASQWPAVCLLGLGHGIGDFNAGILLVLLGASSNSDLVITYLLYNALAFAGQPFAGLICDRVGRPLSWFYLGGTLSALSLPLALVRPELAVLCSGLASAFYHSAGGAAAWELGGRRALAAGVFTGPGVIGLAIGLASSPSSLSSLRWIGGLGMVLVLGLILLTRPAMVAEARPGPSRRGFDRGLLGGILGWLVLLAIAARSFAWSMGQESIFPPEYAVRLALAAAAGKLLAGLLADKLGARRVTVVSLLVAAVLLGIGRSAPVFFFPAATALQAGTAPMMALVLRAWPRHPAFGSGLAQGLAIAVGGAPLLILTRFGAFPVLAATGSLVLAAAIILVVGRQSVASPAADR